MPPDNKPLLPKVARRYARTASTNALAVAAMHGPDPLPPGAVLWADEQTRGRGQGPNRWHGSPGDNLALSLVLRPDHLSVDRLFALTQFTALAVARAVREALTPDRREDVRVKWPNDVYVGDRKIAGILVQNGLRGSRVSWSVIGVGLNVNEAAFPPELRTTATSLSALTGHRHDREAVAATLFAAFTELYPLTAPARTTALGHRYHRQLYRLDVPARYADPATGTIFPATLRGVDPAGRLCLETATGELRRFALREVRFLPLNPPKGDFS